MKYNKNKCEHCKNHLPDYFIKIFNELMSIKKTDPIDHFTNEKIRRCTGAHEKSQK